ncbi:MAG: hypothetical protein ACFFBD_16120 [Candidatus Hodarchaeota archaeon]
MAEPLFISIMEVISLLCLVIVSVSLLRPHVRRKELPPLLMAIAYIITGIIVFLYLLDDLFNPSGNFLGLDNFFEKVPLLILPFSPVVMWLFKLEVFDGGLRNNLRKILIIGLGMTIHAILLILDVALPGTFEEILIGFQIGLVLVILSYVLGTYLLSLLSILSKYEDRTYRVRMQLLLLSLLAFISCIACAIISIVILNLFFIDPFVIEWMAWISITVSSILAFFSFSIPKVLQVRVGLIETESQDFKEK